MWLVGAVLNRSAVQLHRPSSWLYRRVTWAAEKCFSGRTRIGTQIYFWHLTQCLTGSERSKHVCWTELPRTWWKLSIKATKIHLLRQHQPKSIHLDTNDSRPQLLLNLYKNFLSPELLGCTDSVSSPAKWRFPLSFLQGIKFWIY